MTLRGYYRQAARIQRLFQRMTRRAQIRDDLAVRMRRRIYDFDSSTEYRVAYKRWERVRNRAAELLLQALVARNEARDRMYFDHDEYVRERKREEFLRRNCS